MSDARVELRDVQEVAEQARELVARFQEDNADILDAEVHHIGATALPFGHTKGDVDVNVRVEEGRFAALVAAQELLAG